MNDSNIELTPTNMKLLAKDDLFDWSSAQLKMYKNLATLVRTFQVDYADQGSTSSPRALILAPELTLYSDKADTDTVPETVIQSAQKSIEYYDDVPCIDGIPIYDRLSGEPIPFYNLFKVYRDMKDTQSTRSLLAVHDKTDVGMGVLNILSKIWHWQVRVLPYDAQMQREREWTRRAKARKLDNLLSKRGADLIEMAICFIEEHDQQLDPKTALEIIKVLAPITRVATGLVADKPADAEGNNQMIVGNGGSSGVNVSIQNNTANSGGTVHGLSASEVIVKTEKQNEDPNQLASILNVLQKSGAFERSIRDAAADEPIDVEFEDDSE